MDVDGVLTDGTIYLNTQFLCPVDYRIAVSSADNGGFDAGAAEVRDTGAIQYIECFGFIALGIKVNSAVR